jgi:hypothetical protein
VILLDTVTGVEVQLELPGGEMSTQREPLMQKEPMMQREPTLQKEDQGEPEAGTDTAPRRRRHINEPIQH